jgi:putative MATE family efflux protein
MDEKTEEVKILLGDPKKAILKLSLPMIIAMLTMYSYNLIDAMWVAGLGINALAAVSYIGPLYMIWLGISNGLGTGATAIISRYMGAENKIQANNAAFHTLILIFIVSILTTIVGIIILKPFLLFSEILIKPFLLFSDTSLALDLAYQYGIIFIAGSFFMIFSNTSYGILRAEGNVKKTTYAMVLGAILNMILDPLFIYNFSLGISGAAYASILSMIIISILLVIWFKKKTYIKFSYKFFKFNKKIIKQLLYIGLPAGSEFFIFAMVTFVFNILLSIVSGVQAVAVYSAGWRFIIFAAVPLMAISLSVVPVIGVSYGKERFHDFLMIRNYAIKLETLISLIISISIFIFAKQIAFIFTYSNHDPGFFDEMVMFLRIVCFFILFFPIGSVIASMFQGLGRGFDSLILTFIRELVLIVIFAYIFSIILKMGENGVWIGLVVGTILGALISFIYSQIFMKKFLKKNIN